MLQLLFLLTRPCAFRFCVVTPLDSITQVALWTSLDAVSMLRTPRVVQISYLVALYPCTDQQSALLPIRETDR